MNGACNVKLLFGPAPWGPQEGSKDQISFNFNYKVNFFNQTLCVFSQMKDTKHIRQDFHSVPWVRYAPGVGLWGAGVPRGSKKKFFKHGHVVYQIHGDDEQNRMQVNFSS